LGFGVEAVLVLEAEEVFFGVLPVTEDCVADLVLISVVLKDLGVVTVSLVLDAVVLLVEPVEVLLVVPVLVRLVEPEFLEPPDVARVLLSVLIL
jgi:hypothetical protein